MFFQQLVNGLTIGGTYALVTIGFTMVYGVLELTNFAHSSFYMLGAYLTLFNMTTLLNRVTVMGFMVALLVSIVITALLGMAMDKMAISPIRKRKGAPIAGLLATVGAQTCMNDSILLIFGTRSKQFPDAFNLGKFTIGNTVILNMQIVIIVVTVLLMLFLAYIVYKTKLGSAMRAISQNREASMLMGINVEKVIALTFLIASGVAAISGSFVGMYYGTIDTLMAASVGMKSFAAAVLGGMGSVPGAMIGGFIIGVLETMFAGYVNAGMRDAVAFVILIVVLIIRPSGLMGHKEIKKV